MGRATPRDLYAHSNEYLRAMRMLSSQDWPPLVVMGNLAAHTVDLAQKAFLLARGMKEVDFVGRGKIGHDLMRISDECAQRGLGLSGDRMVIEALNIQQNDTNLYRYGKEGYGHSLPLGSKCLTEYVAVLVSEVGSAIPEHAT